MEQNLRYNTLMDLENNNIQFISQMVHQRPVNLITISKDGSIIISGSNDKSIVIFSALDFKPIATFKFDSVIKKIKYI